MSAYVDVHQHLWPEPLVDALRARSTVPMLRGWTLHSSTEAPFEVRATDHDPAARTNRDAGAGRVLVSLSTPIGIERLASSEAAPLLAAWHDGVRSLPAPFAGWAAVHEREPDLEDVSRQLQSGFVGVQVSATQLADPAAIESMAPVLRLCEQLGRPVFVHPGPVTRPLHHAPAWWPAVVDYPAQLQAAWWAWRAIGRSLLPELRICFAAGAGLAPLQHERYAARGGDTTAVDRNVFVDISSYGRQAVDALSRSLGIDVLVLGSDRPYAEPPDPDALSAGTAAWHALSVTNPARLLEGETR
ncbi:MAG TPA: amidohydrolase family protein [Mycobacteriales bacterium]